MEASKEAARARSGGTRRERERVGEREMLAWASDTVSVKRGHPGPRGRRRLLGAERLLRVGGG